MRLLTERLVVRGFVEEDWKDLRRYIHRPEVERWEPPYPIGDQGAQDMATFFAGCDEFWAVSLRSGGQVIGHVHFGQKGATESQTWNLGYVIDPEFHRQGYATECCKEVLRYGFGTLDVRRVEAACHPDNEASWRLLERLGMRREAHHIQNAVIKHTPDGQPIFWDSFVYAILRSEWLRRAA